MDYYSIACRVINQISEILLEESGSYISLKPTGKNCPIGNSLSVEIMDVDIPQNLIGCPNPKFEQDGEGFYKVNRIRIGNTILDDTYKGYPFSKDEIKTYIKGVNTWAYFPK